MIRLVGSARAKEAVHIRKMLNAEEAERIGLVNRVVPHKKLMEEKMAVTRQIAKGSTVTHFGKKSMSRASEHLLKKALEMHSKICGKCTRPRILTKE